MTVWTFGDSYAESYQKPDQWMHRVATKFDYQVNSFGRVGSSMEYTFDKFYSVRNQISNNDIILLALTTYNRRWFFRQHPEHTAYPAPQTSFLNPKLIYSDTGFENINEALELYEDNLKNMKVHETYLLNFLYNLDYVSQKQNTKTIVLINFYDTENFLANKKSEWPNIHFAEEKLLSISLNEYAKAYFSKHDFSKKDVRINHMIRSNHIILANKIIDYIIDNVPVDLRYGFNEHIIVEGFEDDYDFVKNELFSGILIEE